MHGCIILPPSNHGYVEQLQSLEKQIFRRPNGLLSTCMFGGKVSKKRICFGHDILKRQWTIREHLRENLMSCTGTQHIIQHM